MSAGASTEKGSTNTSRSRLGVEYNWELSPVPSIGPLGPGKSIKTAACLIIGDEILNGKTQDTNSNAFAKFCFEHGIALKRIEVVSDDEAEIIEASKRMVQQYDFVVTSGGIGPTHDDITYASLAVAFQQPLKHHPEILRRMQEVLDRSNNSLHSLNAEQTAARERMALLPANAEVLFVDKDLWVPVVRLEGKLCILPGVTQIFRRLLVGLKPYLPLPPASERPYRYQVYTKLPESVIAPFLESLQKRVRSEGISIGSYPILDLGVIISLIGRNAERLHKLCEEIAKEVRGRILADGERIDADETENSVDRAPSPATPVADN